MTAVLRGAGRRKLFRGCKPGKRSKTHTEVVGPMESELLKGGKLFGMGRLLLGYEKKEE